MAAKKGAEIEKRAKAKKQPSKTTKAANPVGRPRVYSDQEIVKGIEDYIADWKAGSRVLPPSTYRCAESMDISRARLYVRAGECEKIQDTLKKLQELEIAAITEGGLTGRYSNPMAIFMLKNLGLTDQPQQEQTDNTVKVIIEQADYGD